MNWDLVLFYYTNQTLANPLLDVLMIVATLGAVPFFFALPVLQLFGPHKRRGRALAAVLLITLAATIACQHLFDQSRPAQVRLILPTVTFPSFPSGHAALAFALAAFVTLAGQRGTALAWVVALLASFSRVYLGHHYPSDIVGGAIVGLAVAVSGYGLLYRAQDHHRPRWAWLLWGQLGLVLLVSLGAYLDLLNARILCWPGADKVGHLVLFGLLSFLMVGWLCRLKPILTILGLVVVAMGEELAQTLSVARTFDLIDLAATTVGILACGRLASPLTHDTRRISSRLDGTN